MITAWYSRDSSTSPCGGVLQVRLMIDSWSDVATVIAQRMIVDSAPRAVDSTEMIIDNAAICKELVH